MWPGNWFINSKISEYMMVCEVPLTFAKHDSDMSLGMKKKQLFPFAKTKTKLISAFVLANGYCNPFTC